MRLAFVAALLLSYFLVTLLESEAILILTLGSILIYYLDDILRELKKK